MILKLISVGILTVISKIDNGVANSDNLINPRRYPNAERDESMVCTYPGSNQMADPYEWLEDVDSDKTKKFIEEETLLTDEYFENAKYAEEINARYAELWNIEKFDGPFRKGIRYFSYRSTDANKEDILYAHKEPIGHGKIIFDPSTLDRSVHFQKASSALSQDGSVFACLTTNISDATSSILLMYLYGGVRFSEERLNYVENFKVAWMRDDGIFYGSYYTKNDNPYDWTSDDNDLFKIYFHELTTGQYKDVLVADFPNTSMDYRFSFEVTDDANFLIVSVYLGSNNLVYVADLKAVNFLIKGRLHLKPLVPQMEAKYEFVTNIGAILIFRTNKDAPRYKLVSNNVRLSTSWNNVVPENDSWVLDWAKPAWNKYMVLAYITEDIRSVLQLYDAVLRSHMMTFELPGGTVKAESFYSNKKNPEIYFKFESFFTSCIIYQSDLTNLSPYPKEVKRITVPNFNPSDYDVKFVNVPNEQYDVMIPTYIIHKKDMEFNGNNFTFLTASGGFGVNLLPYFSATRAVVLKNLNGVLVVANIRGGGEKGEIWHIDGSILNKQNSMNDFKAVAKYLINSKYTSPKLLAIYGGSDGISGPLIGASLNQNPELFAVVIAEAGSMDMLQFDQFDIGRCWVFEYGSPFVEEEFKYLKGYSPLHNVNMDRIQYPATMLLTAIEDDRVSALHSLKFIAKLQNEAKKSSIQENPLILEKTKNTKTTFEEEARISMFIVMNTGIKFKP